MRRTAFILVPLVLLSAVVLICGCETDPATEDVFITPPTSTIQFGQSIQLRASGGYDYTWSLSDNALGTLTVDTGPSTVYTSIYQGTQTGAVQTVTVESTILGSQAGGTNAQSYIATDTATITHI